MHPLLAIGLGAGTLLFASRAAASTSSSAVLEDIAMTAGRVLGRPWELPAAAAPYRLYIVTAEKRHAIPEGLLGRLLYQESRFRPDVISGTTTSSAGAVGIAQIVPRWHPGVNPRDPLASIDYAAKYLTQLRGQLGTWERALAGYNWGPTNVTKAIQEHGDAWLEVAPRETRNYVADITRDVALEGAA